MPTPKKPTALHVLHGNPSKIKDVGKREPKPKPVCPPCPGWLPKKAKEIWKAEAPVLEPLGLLCETDGEEFARYCLLTARAQQAELAIENDGLTVDGAVKGTKVKNPMVQIARDYSAAASKIADKFGMNPVSRSRIEVDGKESADEMETLLSR